MAKEEKKNTFEITLADGTQLAGLGLNGTNFVSKTEISAETFKGKLGHVVINGDKEADEVGLIGEHTNMELLQIAHYTQKTHGCDDGWYFVLRDIPEDELNKIRVNARLDYIEMMEDLA